MNALQKYPREAATHLAMSALAVLQTKQPGGTITVEKLTKEAHALLGPFELQDEAEEAFENAVGEV